MSFSKAASASTYDPDFSLMFDATECAAIQNVRQQDKEKRNNKKLHSNRLHLDGIAYINEQSWSLWMDGQIVDPCHPHDHIEIVSVTAENITFRLKGQDRQALLKMQVHQEIDLDKILYAKAGNERKQGSIPPMAKTG